MCSAFKGLFKDEIQQKIKRAVVLSIIATSLCCFCLCNNAEASSKQQTNNKAKIEKHLARTVDKIYTSMTAEEKIGQIMFIGISGKSLNETDLKFLEKLHFGGTILFDDNMESVEQVRMLNAEIQSKGTLAKTIKNRTYRLPLFSAIDAEGGYVLRMAEKWPYKVPSQEKIGSSDNPNEAKLWAKLVGATINHMGFNINFAPVADVSSPKERSYSKDFKKVTQFVDSAIDGYHEENVICTLKHFPGIGRGVVDSHFDGSVIMEDWQTIENTDLVPFKKAIAEKNNDKLLMMISHLTYLHIDKDNPSSLSHKMITDVLKKELGFKGLVITDALEMGAISKHYSNEEIGVKAINAGVDLALVCHHPESILKIYQGLLDGYKKGIVSETRVEDVVKKIIRIKLTCLN